ncbi:MAG: hypothetical protein KME35_01025 [Aphanocapsa sp. GSE-SYN-MK-11-07L]|jgi:hypothetical protein|nr:hypothetical protein [Aphanocapsa sp. GSE-SYN-MK-11-07L]
MLDLKACPHCYSSSSVKPKLLMLAKYSATEATRRDNNCGYQRRDQLAIDQYQAALLPPPLEQFVGGLYCQTCGVGYVPDAELHFQGQRESC